MTAPGTGHCAPDFEKPATHFNTLRVRPEYRISLRMSDIEELFVKEADTKEGKKKERMARMQVLGLFYFPLKHDKAADRFNTTWEWFKTRILGNVDDAAADAALKRGLKSRIVSAAAIPAWSAGPSALPPDAADPTKPEAANFAKIRVPGGYTFCRDDTGRNLNYDANYPNSEMVHSRFDYEEYFYKDNLILGKLPFIAKVEKRTTPESDWAPAKDVTVLFQLVAPYAADKPAYDASVAASGQFARPPLRATQGLRPDSGSGIGPKKMVEGKENYNVDPADPQGKNCHLDRGGKRGYGDLNDGTDVDGQLFATTSTPGFNAKHSATQAMSHKDLEVASKMRPVNGKHKHAVKAKTNEDGEAGVIFTPSRMGGDRYRLRAYIGPPTQQTDGEEIGSVAATTGTFIVWRNIRVSRYIQHVTTVPPDPRLVTQLYPPAPVTDTKNQDYLRTAWLFGLASPTAAAESFLGLDTADFTDPSAGQAPAEASTPNYEAIPTQFAHGFCEVEMDSGSATPETLSQSDWETARNTALADAKVGAANMLMNIDCDKLFWADITPAVADVVAHVVLQLPADYNAALPATSTQRFTLHNGTLDTHTSNQMADLLWNYVTPGFQRGLSKDGALPGLTLIQGGFGNTWQLAGLHDGNSGWGADYRACCVWLGSPAYPPRSTALTYNLTSNSIHELGHTLFRPHARSRPGHTEGGGANTGAHDPVADCLCVMSYDTCVGQFCGRCLLIFRGWKPV
jgi:hypothetical protein